MEELSNQVVSHLGDKVQLYRRDDAGFVWHYRIWVKESQKYVRKTTGATNLDEAKKIAEEAYYDVRAKLKAEIPVFSKTFADVFKLALDDERRKVERKELSEKRYKWYSSIANLYYLPYFKNYQISAITTGVVGNFWKERMDFWKLPEEELKAKKRKYRAKVVAQTPTGSTLHLEKRILDMVINKAVELGYISQAKIPKTKPPVKNSRERRPALTMEQWQKMRDYLRYEWPDATWPAITEESKRYQAMLYYYCFVLISTGIRITDARHLKWQNVGKYTDLNGQTSTHLQVWGKKNYRDVIGNRALYGLLPVSKTPS